MLCPTWSKEEIKHIPKVVSSMLLVLKYELLCMFFLNYKSSCVAVKNYKNFFKLCSWQDAKIQELTNVHTFM